MVPWAPEVELLSNVVWMVASVVVRLSLETSCKFSVGGACGCKASELLSSVELLARAASQAELSTKPFISWLNGIFHHRIDRKVWNFTFEVWNSFDTLKINRMVWIEFELIEKTRKVLRNVQNSGTKSIWIELNSF